MANVRIRQLGEGRTPHGSVYYETRENKAGKTIYAFASVRDADGKRRRASGRGATKQEALDDLEDKLAVRPAVPKASRKHLQPTPERGDLITAITHATPDSLMRDVFALWLADVNSDRTLAAQTRQFYRYTVLQTVLPRFGDTPVREMNAGEIDRYIKAVRDGDDKYGNWMPRDATGKPLPFKPRPGAAKNIRKVMRLVFDMVVRDEALKTNPIAYVRRTKRSHEDVRAYLAKTAGLTAPQVAELRRLIKVWREDGLGSDGAPRDPRYTVTDAFEVMIGTGLRISECLGLTKDDLELDADIPTLMVTGTLIQVHGAGGLQRQPFPKSLDSERQIALPAFVVEALRRQLALSEHDELVFSSRNGKPVNPNNVRRSWNEARRGSALEWVTPHTCRRTIGTLLADEESLDIAAEQLGHSDPAITKEFYVRKQKVAADNAALLDRMLSEKKENEAA